MHLSLPLLMTVVIAAGGFCHWLAWRLKVPAILFFLAVGILLGPGLGWFNGAMLNSQWLPSFVSLAVAVILFEGSLTLRFQEIKGLEQVVRRLVTYAALAGAVVTTVAVVLIFRLPWELAALFGALTVVTGPTVITPLLRTVRPREAVARILQWEGIIIDPLGALLAVLMFNLVVALAEQHNPTRAFAVFTMALVAGSVVGLFSGWLWGRLLRSRWLPEYLETVCTLAAVLCAFSGANLIVHESGLLAVTVMGVFLANLKDLDLEAINSFKENLTLTLVASLFILLAACLDLASLVELGWRPLLLVLVMQLLSRPLVVGLATVGSKVSLKERFIIAWIGPRGIIAAAIASLFAIHLTELGIAEAQIMIPIAFAVIIGSVAIPGLTARPLARWLGVAEPEARGFLVVGANPVARTVALALQEAGARIMLADNSWSNIREARQLGLPAYYGSPISAHADSHLSLVGLGRLLGLSMHDDFNNLAVLRFRGEFGRRRVFALPAGGKEPEDNKIPAQAFRGRVLFGAEVRYAKLASLVAQGAETHRTELTEVYSWEKFQEDHGGRAVILFTIDPAGIIRPLSADEAVSPVSGWQLIYLEAETSQEPGRDQRNSSR